MHLLEVLGYPELVLDEQYPEVPLRVVDDKEVEDHLNQNLDCDEKIYLDD